MTISKQNIRSTLAGLLDRMDQCAQANCRLTGFGRTTLDNVILQLRHEVLCHRPDELRIRDAVQIWTNITGEEHLAGRLLAEFSRLWQESRTG